jgi:hypothetical protein
VAEKSPQRCLRVLAESGQEFIRVGKSLPLPCRPGYPELPESKPWPQEGVYLGKFGFRSAALMPS